ncbi:hypothetical protein FOCG_02364 [Fusarium oxysporum f. sp. radicis-lycopersici 26381]|uniref:Uncharacterized protein n=3 Tax=Fusarium oxysporum TaxID=5507 RepID=A0A0J9UXT8_FUSO4|nr:hypothetical protein FOXG_19180 [Fusarium oxysporum f. sp. lycopersici 4287]EWZ42631.1 hypothetical protein FOZG_07490 [Fusarium oxysporum Fo47]EXA00286.1 hypothetical protein FOWG_00566 [Fusarium oxysporum f. sp. lycopersici MN25]EXK33268.1 hypothetical protein FOMG_11996 [Fusarium oxysporum f. sp. melonis 26406]EXL58962.1 hypothetical protein FOCG_02364 [Fusarium oxysporum f. sp. radicis-lycopersici 26381]KNB03688.1 hypothetical protein FOXG_19180 [Fusarium oxysporum f. sp. lycopersici 42
MEISSVDSTLPCSRQMSVMPHTRHHGHTSGGRPSSPLNRIVQSLALWRARTVDYYRLHI